MRVKRHQIEVLALSVSSVGSEAMQRMKVWKFWLGVIFFQYPRSDRRRCNTPPQRLGLAAKPTFSILGRIGGDATAGWRVPVL